MIGTKLTSTQALELRGKFLNDSCTFEPVIDINGDYFIFEGEVNDCTNEDFMWVKDLPTAEYVAPINNEI